MARLTYAQQRARTRELDELRIQRGLTAEERAEADKLALQLYYRVLRMAA